MICMIYIECIRLCTTLRLMRSSGDHLRNWASGHLLIECLRRDGFEALEKVIHYHLIEAQCQSLDVGSFTDRNRGSHNTTNTGRTI